MDEALSTGPCRGIDDAARPCGRRCLTMRWHDLLFVHWRVPPEHIERLLPCGLRPDVFDGSAWVGLIPFTMTGVRILGMWLPTATTFHECNVRTYVTVGDEPGVHFFSLDAASALAVTGARLTYALPYHRAQIDIARQGDRVDYRVRRCGGPSAEIAWRVGESISAQPGTLEWFLTERYCLYVGDRRGRVCRGRIWHPRWKLRTANLLRLQESLLASAAIEVSGSPASVFASDGTWADAWPLERPAVEVGQTMYRGSTIKNFLQLRGAARCDACPGLAFAPSVEPICRSVTPKSARELGLSTVCQLTNPWQADALPDKTEGIGAAEGNRPKN